MMVLLFFASHEIKFWGGVVVFIIIGFGYLTVKLTKGRSTEYLKYKLSDKLKNALVAFHGLCSLVLALVLPNNYLNEIESVRQLYNQNDLWIAASIFALLFLFLTSVGLLLTSIVKLLGFKKSGT